MCPIEDTALKARLLDEVLGTMMRDDVKARALQPDGSYAAVAHGPPHVRSQVALLDTAKQSATSPAPASPVIRSGNVTIA
jgi:polyphosphate kinase